MYNCIIEKDVVLLEINNKAFKTKEKAKHFSGYNKSRIMQVYSMAAVPLLLVFIFSYLPMFGIILAFKNYRYDLGIWGSDWVGIKNFKFFFESNDCVRILRNTLGLNALFITAGLFAAVVVALLLF